MRFIGITGGVGAGKTEILKYIGQHYKCEIYLADDIGHKVKEPGTEGYAALVEACEAHHVERFETVMSLTGMVNVGAGSLTVGFAAPPHTFT